MTVELLAKRMMALCVVCEMCGGRASSGPVAQDGITYLCSIHGEGLFEYLKIHDRNNAYSPSFQPTTRTYVDAALTVLWSAAVPQNGITEIVDYFRGAMGRDRVEGYGR